MPALNTATATKIPMRVSKTCLMGKAQQYENFNLSIEGNENGRREKMCRS